MRTLKILGFLFVVLVPGSVAAQNTKITATITDPSVPVSFPYANGTGSARIVCPGNAQPYIGTSPLNRNVSLPNLDSFGGFSTVVWDVNSITTGPGTNPGTCAYQFTFTDSCGIASFTSPLLGGVGQIPVITGSGPVDLTAALKPYVPPISQQCRPAGGGSGTVQSGTPPNLAFYSAPTQISSSVFAYNPADVGNPIPLASDNFNRANESPLNPLVWTTAIGQESPAAPPYVPLAIVNNVVQASTPIDAVELYTGVTWPNNQWAQMSILKLTNQAVAALLMRSDSTSNTSYGCEMDDNGDGTFTLFLEKFIGTTNSFVATTFFTGPPTPFVSGTVLKCATFGSSLLMYLNGTLIAGATDTAIVSGKPAVWLSVGNTTDAQVDDFVGGTFDQATSCGLVAACADITTTQDSTIGLVSTDGSTEAFLGAVSDNPNNQYANQVPISANSELVLSPTAMGFWSGTFIGGTTGGGNCFMQGLTSPPCSVGYVSMGGDTLASESTASGQDIVSFAALVGLHRATPTHVGDTAGFLMLTPANCNTIFTASLPCPPAQENANRMWGLEVQDLKGTGTTMTAGVHIETQSNPGANNYAIKVEPGGGPTRLDDKFVLNATSSGSGIQGTDTKLLTSGTVGAAGSTLCVSANGGATTTGCTGGGGGGTVTSFSYSQTGMDQVDLPTVLTPTTTPLLQLVAQPTQPGFALMGPVPTPGGTNPSFESAVVNSAVGVSSVTVSGTPANAASAAIFMAFCGDGTHAAAPTPGTWITIDNSVNIQNGAIYASNLGSGARISPLTACSGNTTSVSSLGFFGGTVSSVPHSSTLAPTCGIACNTGTLGPITAGNLIMVVATWASSSVNIPNPTVSDSAGNTYVKVATAYQTAATGVGHFVYVSQFVGAGTPTITVNGNENGVNFAAVRAYEISGLTSYYNGVSGPFTFRAITPQDIQGLHAPAVQLSSFTTLGGNVSVGNTATSILALNVTMPTSGCPCRVRLDYGLYLNFPNTNVSAWSFWINDGTAGSTHTLASLQTGQSNASTGARTSANAGAYTQLLYGNGAVVTFTLFGQGTGATTMTVEGPPQVGAGTNSWMQAEVMTSN